MLPQANFKLLTEQKIQTLFPDKQHSLDLGAEDFPRHIHCRISDFPLSPEAAQVAADMLSPFMHELYNKLMTEYYPNKITARKFKSLQSSTFSSTQP